MSCIYKQEDKKKRLMSWIIVFERFILDHKSSVMYNHGDNMLENDIPMSSNSSASCHQLKGNTIQKPFGGKEAGASLNKSRQLETSCEPVPHQFIVENDKDGTTIVDGFRKSCDDYSPVTGSVIQPKCQLPSELQPIVSRLLILCLQNDVFGNVVRCVSLRRDNMVPSSVDEAHVQNGAMKVAFLRNYIRHMDTNCVLEAIWEMERVDDGHMLWLIVMDYLTGCYAIDNK